MQRWTVALFAAALGLAVVLIVKFGAGRSPAPTASASEGDRRSPILVGSITPPPVPTLALAIDAGIQLPLDDEAAAPGSAYAAPSDSTVPALPNSAPGHVSFGAILVEYAGAQGVGRGGRPKEEARILAKRLAAKAKIDFAAAVADGDKGSDEDYGDVPRGVLEAGPEYVLFTLKKGEVSDPVDSPRGFYIFKRND